MISINVLSFFYVNRLDFRDTHQMKDYPNVLQTWNINVAVKITLISYMDIISTNLLFLEESWSVQSYTQMAQTFMQTVNGEKSFKWKSIAEIA